MAKETREQAERWIKRAKAALKNPSLLGKYDNVSEIRNGIKKRQNMLSRKKKSAGGKGG